MEIIGRKDKADFPALEIANLEVKIDSGAYSCSIHCESAEEVNYGGKTLLKVVFLDREHPLFSGKSMLFEHYRRKSVKSSTGVQQVRFFIQLDIILFGESLRTDFSLTQRNGLRHPVLLGRKLLNKRFVIDTSKVNLSYKRKKRQATT